MKYSLMSVVIFCVLVFFTSCIRPSKEDEALIKLRTILLQRYDRFDDIEIERSEIETKVNGKIVGKRYLLLIQFVDRDISYSWNKLQIDTVAHFAMSQYHIKPLDTVKVSISAFDEGKAVQRTYSFPASIFTSARDSL